MEVLQLAGFRTHFLLPHDYVGAVTPARPVVSGIELQELERAVVYHRHDRAFMQVSQRPGAGGKVTVTLEALAEVWVQEPGLTAVVEGETEWRGFGPGGKWVATDRGVTGWLDLEGVPDAHRATVHWKRTRPSDDYTVGVACRGQGRTLRFRSDGGFSRLLTSSPPRDVPWRGCEVFGRGVELAGVAVNESGRPRLRWELASHKPQAWMHFLGWGGGAAAVTNEAGLDVGIDGDRFLWDPPAWRRMLPGDRISQWVSSR